jgi:hypothetical protein
MLARWGYEIRIIGWLNWLVPIFAVAGVVALIALAAFDNLHNGVSAAAVHTNDARFLRRLPEYVLPLAGGIVASALPLGDPARELHLALPRSYRGTALRRLGLLTLWLALVGGAVIEAIRLTGFWGAPFTFPQDQLIWAAPTLAFIALGAVLALLLHSRAASGAILGVIWVGEIFFGGFLRQYDTTRYAYLFLSSEAPTASYWLGNRLALLTTAGMCAALVWVLLGRREALLGSEA